MVDRFEKFSLAISEISRYWHKIAAEELKPYELKVLMPSTLRPCTAIRTVSLPPGLQNAVARTRQMFPG